jgi:hypothetical protein
VNETKRAWLGAAAVVSALVLLVTCAAWLWPHPSVDPHYVDPARIRVACQMYAGYDLAGFASICRDAGYQQAG